MGGWILPTRWRRRARWNEERNPGPLSFFFLSCYFLKKIPFSIHSFLFFYTPSSSSFISIISLILHSFTSLSFSLFLFCVPALSLLNSFCRCDFVYINEKIRLLYLNNTKYSMYTHHRLVMKGWHSTVSRVAPLAVSSSFMKIREQARPDYGQSHTGGFTQRTGGRRSAHST